MTFIGKLLVFINLIVGIGFAVFGTAVYTERPTWFTPPADGMIDKGQVPMSFTPLAAEIDANAKSAAAASRTWGANWRALQGVEKRREERKTLITSLLLDARNGDKTRGGAGFFNLPEESSTKLLDLSIRTDIVKGPDGQPLQGSETLQSRLDVAQKGIIEMAEKSKKHRADQLDLTAKIGVTETRVLKQTDIRNNLTTEAATLAALEVNVTLDRDTTQKRRDQLKKRLATLLDK